MRALRLLGSCASALAFWGTLSVARAETLAEALVDAYNNNPQILAERALLRATDEGVPQALSGWRPTVQFTGSAGIAHLESRPASPPVFPGDTGTVPRSVDVNLTQPLFTGGRTVALTAQAEKSVEAERARNIAVEESVFLAAIQSFLDVVRDQATLDLAVNNEQVLRRQLEATQDQFRVGAVTRTDVAQAEARLAGATASREQAAGNLQVSRANFERAVGHPPGTLTQPDQIPTLPATRDEAIALAGNKNPNVVSAIFTEDAARDAVDATRDQLLPNLALVGDANRGIETSTPRRETTNYSVIARVSIPLYEGGAIYSQTRQAAETVGQRRGQTDDARRAAIQGATQAWEQIVSGRAQVLSLHSTVRAAEIALDGVRQEQTVGTRTILDVLNAEQELFTDRVQLVTAEHDLALAEFSLASQIGRLTAADLKLPVALYDVDRHYRSVRDKWLGFGGKD
jgi:outer membrane protein